MPALAYFIPSNYHTDAPTASHPAMLHRRDIDGGAVGVILILLTVGCVLAVFLFIVCIKQARARQHETRGHKAGFAKHEGDVPLSLRTHRRTNARTGNAAQSVGLGISGADQEPDLGAGPELPAPTPPPPSYHTNSLRRQRTDRSGPSRHQGLAGRTMRSGANASNRSRPPQSINQFLQSRAGSGSSAAGEGARAAAQTAVDNNGRQRRGSAGSRESWER